MQVFFIDDERVEVEPLLQFALSQGATAAHYDWVDGGDAFYRAADGTTDLVILLDLYFSDELQGPKILQSLRTWRPDLPVIVFTSRDDIETGVSAIRDWGASDVFPKSSTQFERLWTVVERCSKERHQGRARLQRALKLAEATDSKSRFEGLVACREILASSPEHESALRGKRLALMGLLKDGVKQEDIPLVRGFQELLDTCRTLHDVGAEPEPENLRCWKLACVHLDDMAALRLLGNTCLLELRHDDPVLADIIRWQFRHDAAEIPPVEPEGTLAGWVDLCRDEPVRLSAHMRLALALRSLRRDLSVQADLAASAYVGKLCDMAPGMAAIVVEGEMGHHGDELVIDVLCAGDRSGALVVPVIVHMIDERLAASPRLPVTLVRTRLLIEQLSRWKAKNIDQGRLQQAAATLALELIDEGAERDACLAVACKGQVEDANAAKDVLDVLAVCDVPRLTAVYSGWLDQAQTSGRQDVLDALVGWAVANRGTLMRGPAEIEALQNIIRCLERVGRRGDAILYAEEAIDRGLRDLRLSPVDDRATALTKLNGLLHFIEQHGASDVLMRARELETRLTGAAAGLFQLPPVLAGKRVAVVAGAGVNPDLLPQYRIEIERQLGATCGVYPAENDQRVKALCDSIKTGGVDIMVTMLGSVGHSVSGRVREAIKEAERCMSEPVLVELPTAQLGARAVVKAIIDKLRLPDAL